MIRVQFNNQKSAQNVEFKMISETSVKLSGQKLKKNTSGFKVFRLSGELLGDYSDFIKCTESDNGFIFEKIT